MQRFITASNLSSPEREPSLALSHFSTTLQRALVAKNFELSAVGRLEHAQLLRKSSEEEWSTSSGKYFRLQSICFHLNSLNKLIVSSTACGQLCIFLHCNSFEKHWCCGDSHLSAEAGQRIGLDLKSYAVSTVVKVMDHSVIAKVLLLVKIRQEYYSYLPCFASLPHKVRMP